MNGITFKFFQPIGQNMTVICHRNCGQRHTVRGVCVSAYCLPEHMHHPVGSFAHGNQCIQRPRRSPHNITACFIIFRILHRDFPAVNQRLKQSFHDIIRRIVIGSREILLQNMRHDIVTPRYHLILGQGIRKHRI